MTAFLVENAERLREAERLVLGNTASEWESRDYILILLAPKSCSFPDAMKGVPSCQYSHVLHNNIAVKIRRQI